MNPSLWGNLPEEFLDHIVAFLPLPALSRFRVVSKKYSTWIFSPQFQKLGAQLPLRESQVWMACRGKLGGVVSTNFKVSAGANLYTSAQHQAMLPYFGPQWKQYMRAALGSLLFVECTNVPDVMGGKPPLDGSDPVLYEMICDFSTMTCARLPKPIVLPERWYGYSHVMFGQCGDDTGAFKIAIMDLTHYGDQKDGKPYSFQVYDSVTTIWKELHPEATFDFKFGDLINCTFMFDKVFCLLRVGSSVEECFHEIVVFDTATEKYNCAMLVGLPDKHRKLASLKLLAANGKLHLTGWIEDKRLLVFEVDLPNKNIIKVAQLPKPLMQGIMSRDVDIAGHKDCIFVYSRKRNHVIYDFCRKTWRVLGFCPLLRGELLSSNFHFYVEDDNAGGDE